MTTSTQLIQSPIPGSRLLRFRGDVELFRLTLAEKREGKAWLRTNLEHGRTIRSEIIEEVRNNIPRLAKAWYDIPMQRAEDGSFHLRMPLCEVGHFEAKCFFIPEGHTQPEWPTGANTAINVEPADSCGANIIYNAFVRQFGPNKYQHHEKSDLEHFIRRLDQDRYTVIPPSGTFRNLIAELDFIVGTLGCRYIQLLPIHPTPTTYARMGRFGSPYAALSFTDVDPALAEFDPQATPLEQFIELLDAAHRRNAKIILDIAINHTGWAANLHESHPQWLVRDESGRIEAPGAWGVVWADLTKLDYSHKDLWQYMADIFLTWCRRGVDGFRCDAGYMIPLPAWEYIVATVRSQYPDTVFLLEGLGGEVAVTRDLLNQANLNWAYSELFQNYDRRQIESYLPQAIDIAQGEGLTVHFAETHDNNRLASRSPTYAKMRTALCALCAEYGAFGFANGVEWYATQKIIVHEAPSLNWGATPNQVDYIRRLNGILKNHPTYFDQTELTFLTGHTDNCLAVLRSHRPSGKKLLILINLDDQEAAHMEWDRTATGMVGNVLINLLNGRSVAPHQSERWFRLRLAPGQVLCLTDDPQDLESITHAEQSDPFQEPPRITHQRLRAKVLEVFTYYRHSGHLGSFDPDPELAAFQDDPEGFCLTQNSFSTESRVITWHWPTDAQREVMIPPRFFLLVKAPHLFRAQLMDGRTCLKNEQSLLCRSSNDHFVLFSPYLTGDQHRRYHLKLSIYDKASTHAKAPLLYLARHEAIRLPSTYSHAELLEMHRKILATNSRGGMLRASTRWGFLESRYDALLAANINPDFPENRRILLTRVRGWVVFQGFSIAINDNCLNAFYHDERRSGLWCFHIPTGQGQHVILYVQAAMHAHDNLIQLTFFRQPAAETTQHLADRQKVLLILRPDIEDRSFHETTKAYLGAETHFPNSITPGKKGFIFEPNPPVGLQATITDGTFTVEPEWQYMVHRPLEAERGLDPDSDLFSPGYFQTELEGGQRVVFTAEAATDGDQPAIPPTMRPKVQDFDTHFSKAPDLPFASCLRNAINRFIVKRGRLNTVIAGYPWFLDWGRDTLIFVQSLIEIGLTNEAHTILLQFAELEEKGTIPNMIHGANASNRDTSDAPLWFFLGCKRLVDKEGQNDFLNTEVKNRTIRTILSSMAVSIIEGTPNGIYMDSDSGLIFSPSHYTWMDTNYPAGTPREGYPIEIQALWQAAVSFLADMDRTPDQPYPWRQLAARIKKSIMAYFFRPSEGFLSDCLHAKPGEPVPKAQADDALRPNQLLAITLGAIDDNEIAKRILTACQELLIPGAIRSLADRPVSHPIAITHQGQPLNDPWHPYQGTYQGDEDTHRKPAYHNGTAWTWMFPSFSEAWAMVYGQNAIGTALSWLSSSSLLLESGCVGQIPEILDGDFPHRHRGCDAQAWGSSELLRVWNKLDRLL